MGEPFRDEMSAVMSRAERLEDENDELRSEIERLKSTASAVKSKRPNDLLADQTLRALEQLAAASQRRPAVGADAAIVTRVDPSTEPVRAELPVPRSPMTSPLRAPDVSDNVEGPRSWSTGTLVRACVFSVVVGALIEWLLAHLQ